MPNLQKLILFISCILLAFNGVVLYKMFTYRLFGFFFYIELLSFFTFLILAIFFGIKSGYWKEIYQSFKEMDSNQILAIVAVISLIISCWSSYNSIKLQEKVIDMTPSKYAYIESMAIDYTDGAFYISIDKINKEKRFEVGFNIINTGQLDTDKIQISVRNNNSDHNFILQIIEFSNIASKSNQAFKLNFSIENPLTSLGYYQINLSIMCTNCKEQGILSTNTLRICVYNNSYEDCK